MCFLQARFPERQRRGHRVVALGAGRLGMKGTGGAKLGKEEWGGFPQARLGATVGRSPVCRIGGACFSLPSNPRQKSEKLREIGGLLSQAVFEPYGRVSKTVAALSSGW